jgi:hypothetical protein
VALVREAGDQMKITFFKSFGENKINELKLTYKFTHNFVGPATNGLGPDVARKPGPR